MTFQEMTFEVEDANHCWTMTVTTEDGETFLAVEMPHRDDTYETIYETAQMQAGEDFIDVALRLMTTVAAGSEAPLQAWA